MLRGDVRARAREPELLIVTKANSTATVHRAELLDYVGVKTFDSRGRVDGEHRFLGLWTSTAYHGSPRDIPVLRRKVERVIEHFGLDPASHDGKAVLNVLETYPRDELFQAGVPDLIRIVRGVVNLYERRTVRLLVRRDPYHRFYSCLVYVPRDRYNTEVRQRIEQIALEGFAGTSVESQAQISGASHARAARGGAHRSGPAPQARLCRHRAAHRRGRAHLGRPAARGAHRAARRGGGTGARQRATGTPSRSPTRRTCRPQEVLDDLRDLEALRQQPRTLQLSLHRPAGQKPRARASEIVRLADPVPISDVLPMLENFGLRVISERPYELAWPEGGAAWIQDFELEHRDGAASSTSRASKPTSARASPRPGAAPSRTTASTACCSAPTSPRARSWCCAPAAATCCRPVCPSARRYMERALGANAAIARSLVRLFQARFDPAAGTQPPAAASARRTASSSRSAPASMRWRASTTIGSCAPT